MNNIFKEKLSDFDRAAIKLSVFYVLIVMIISIFFSISIYNISTKEVGRGVGKTMGIIDNCAPGHLPPGFESLERVRIDQIQEINDRIKVGLYYFNLIILIVSSGLSYFLAKKTLHPLEQAMESQNRFTADASHELRTPLAAMRSEIEVALRDKKISPDDAKKLFESNIEEIVKLENLSETLLKLARYQNYESDFKEVNICEAIVEAYEKVAHMAEKKQIVFENDLREVEVNGDKQSLVQLFVVLLDNAIKYSGKGEKILIKVSQIGKHASVSIKDYGSGIKASDLPYIFERFYRGESSRNKAKTNGYGLGLSLAKQIVDMHRGKISVKSVSGKGAEFTVFI